MKIEFTRHAEGWHSIRVRNRRVGPDVFRRPRETGPTLPHDLAHAAVEAALNIDDGFWSAFDRGATFDDFQPIEPGRHRRSGLRQLRAVGEREQRAELAVSWAHRVWSGQRVQGPGLGVCPLSQDELVRAGRALDRALALWRGTAEGEMLVWSWPG